MGFVVWKDKKEHEIPVGMPPKIFLCSLVLLLFLCLTFPLPGRANEEENEEEEEVWTTEKARARCVELAQLDPTFAVLNNFTHSSSEIIETESGLVAWNPCQVIEECGSSLCKKRRGRDGVWISMGGNLEEIARKDENGWEGISMKFVGGSSLSFLSFDFFFSFSFFSPNV